MWEWIAAKSGHPARMLGMGSDPPLGREECPEEQPNRVEGARLSELSGRDVAATYDGLCCAESDNAGLPVSSPLLVVARRMDRPGRHRRSTRPATGGAACTGRRWPNRKPKPYRARPVRHQKADVAAARRREAETQLRLASEGFLPGYSFPRLPLAAYIPGSRRVRSDGDYLQ
jgi:hypothetical protein